jgi:folate-dependent phosphoribosylglycinamide formyltransferase PurN
MRVAVTAGYWSSKTAIALMHGLRRRGHTVPVCLVASVLGWKRIRGYWRAYRADLWTMATRRLLGGGRPSRDQADDMRPLAAYLEAENIRSRTVKEAAREIGARAIVVSDLNGPRSVAVLKDAEVDLLVYSGGGILRPNLLAVPARGTLNAHSGPLPGIRGMNALEWSLLLSVTPGITIHFIDAGVDTGPILRFLPIPVQPHDTIPSLRGKAALLGVSALLEAVDNVETLARQARNQSLEQGKQYFVMHPRLKQLAEQRISTLVNPLQIP